MAWQAWQSSNACVMCWCFCCNWFSKNSCQIKGGFSQYISFQNGGLWDFTWCIMCTSSRNTNNWTWLRIYIYVTHMRSLALLIKSVLNCYHPNWCIYGVNWLIHQAIWRSIALNIPLSFFSIYFWLSLNCILSLFSYEVQIMTCSFSL